MNLSESLIPDTDQTSVHLQGLTPPTGSAAATPPPPSTGLHASNCLSFVVVAAVHLPASRFTHSRNDHFQQKPLPNAHAVTGILRVQSHSIDYDGELSEPLLVVEPANDVSG